MAGSVPPIDEQMTTWARVEVRDRVRVRVRVRVRARVRVRMGARDPRLGSGSEPRTA